MTFTWQTITLGTYAAIDALSRAKTSDVMQRDVSLLSMLTGKTEEYFMGIPFPELTALRKEMHEFLAKTPEEKYCPEFECNGRRYKVAESPEEFTGAQLEGTSALRLTDENYARNSHYVTAILCHEIPTEINVWVHKSCFKWRNRFEKQTVPVLSVREKAADFEKHLPASVALGINGFFFSLLRSLVAASLGEDQQGNTEIEERSLVENEKPTPSFGASKVSMHEHYGHFYTLFELSGRDYTKMDYWREQSISYIFSCLAFRKDLMEDEK